MERVARINAESGLLKHVAAAMRKEATPAEKRAWSFLRGRRFMGLKFRRQHVVEGKIVDFYCAELRLCLELDGQPHRGQMGRERDELRDGELRMKGYTVIRFENFEFLKHPGTFAAQFSKLCQAPPL